ncbi:uncharacterized protein LOC128392895 [Panonychus citri]|uniref:uncharacterized protein LOC128392895 n=1 Tax=Panonychus citri TaxID=50023 RepID=UPI0023070C29|nr:uncharacterized protein LOC128392895 [Panonychus citri]
MLRATSRKAFGSIVSRKFTLNGNEKSDSSNCSNSNNSSSSSSTGQDNQNGSQRNASGKKSYQCRLEGFVDLQRMFFHSIGIFGSLIIIGHKFHTDCIRFKSSSPSFGTDYLSSPSLATSEDHHGCSFLYSLNKNLPHLVSNLNPSSYQQNFNVLPFHVLPVSSASSSSSSSLSSFESDKEIQHEESSIKDTNVIDRIVENMRSELDLFTDELKNLQASVLLQRNQIDKAISLLKSCPKSAKAMFNLGIVYESGQHDPINGQPNYSIASKYYTNAASLGHRMAHYNLALIYLYGKQPIEMDKAKGMSLLHRAAELGVQEAQQFVNRERLLYSQLRDIRIRHSEELLDKLNAKKTDITSKNNPTTDKNNNFHTSLSSPNFLTSIMSFLEPSVKDESTIKPTKINDSVASELFSFKEDETIYDSDDSLEVVFTD